MIVELGDEPFITTTRENREHVSEALASAVSGCVPKLTAASSGGRLKYAREDSNL